jgi:alcohol dehydrogenase class IV
VAHWLGPLEIDVAGRTPARSAVLLERLRADRVQTTTFSVAHEPTTAVVLAGVARAQAAGCDLVIALGGGSVLDAGKAIAALMTNPGDPLDYLEVVGQGRALRIPAAPCIAIPTTAGTGSEVTRNAVLGVPEQRLKVSLRSPLLLPRSAIVDPELTYDMPPAITAWTGLDALTQCIEPFVSPAASPFTDALAREGLRRAAGALRRAFDDGRDTAARTDMALASLCGGLALANAKLGAVHGCASPLGGMFPVPHGAICGRLLPLVVELNVRALQARAPESPSLQRYREVAQIVTGEPSARAEDAAPWLRELVAYLGVPALATFGVVEAEIPAVVAAAQHASSMGGNPIALDDTELTQLLLEAVRTPA